MSFELTSSTFPQVRSRVYVRPSAGGAFVDGDDDGWMLDTELRCDYVRHEAGVRVGIAQIAYVPHTPTDSAFDEILAGYSTDDQVKVVVDPVVDQGVDQPSDGDDESDGQNGHVLFVGMLGRHTSDVRGDAQRGGEEVVGFVAQAWPAALDNRDPRHMVFGPWYLGGVVESPDCPAIFNAGGQPNRDSAHPLTWTYGDAGHTAISFYLFCDPTKTKAKLWTVAHAINAVLTICWRGFPDHPLPRTFDVDFDLLVHLQAPDGSTRPPRYQGLDDVLPETSVQGLHVLDAIAAICQAAGFEFGFSLVDDDKLQTAGGGGPGSADRRYVLSIWRRNNGDLVQVDLGKRGSSYTDGEKLLRANNAIHISGMRDGTEVVNEIYAVAPTRIECQLELIPLWKKSDVDPTDLTEIIQDPDTDDLKTTGTWQAKHVLGGIDSAKYADVGRAWGIACVEPVNDAAGKYAGYGGKWSTASAPFNFLEALGLDDPANAQWSAFFADRKVNVKYNPSTGEADGMLVWASRTRKLLPCASPDAIAAGVQYLLEVTEDDGESWAPCNISFRTLDHRCGIFLSVPNLARVNIDALVDGYECEIEKSWWALILHEETKFRFRITCTIEADHCQRFDGLRRGTSGTIYRAGQWLRVEREEIWLAPNTPFNDDSPAIRVAGFAPQLVEDPSKLALATQDAANRRLDLLQDRSISLAVGICQMDFDRYKIGQRIQKIAGRNYDLASSGGTTPNYPTVVGVNYNIGPGAQSIELSLEDHRMASAR